MRPQPPGRRVPLCRGFPLPIRHARSSWLHCGRRSAVSCRHHRKPRHGRRQRSPSRVNLGFRLQVPDFRAAPVVAAGGEVIAVGQKGPALEPVRCEPFGFQFPCSVAMSQNFYRAVIVAGGERSCRPWRRPATIADQRQQLLNVCTGARNLFIPRSRGGIRKNAATAPICQRQQPGGRSQGRLPSRGWPPSSWGKPMLRRRRT